MKTLSKLIILIFIGILFYSNSGVKTNDIELLTAINKGQINCKALSNGNYSGKSILLKILNKSTQILKVKIKKGTAFYPKNANEQTLITLEDQIVTLQPNTTNENYIKGYCSEHFDRCPTKNNAFRIEKDPRPKFDSLFVFMKNLMIPESDFQAITWAITDNSSVSNISSDSEDLKKLKKKLFKFTNQQEVNYSVQNQITVLQDGRIITKPVTISGELEFTVDKNEVIQQKIFTKDQKLIEQLPISFSVLEGKTKFNFIINVVKYKKGDYIFQLSTKGKICSEYEFSI